MKKIKLGWKKFPVAGETYDLLLEIKKDQRLDSGDEAIRWMVGEILRLRQPPVKEFPVVEPEVKPDSPIVKPEIIPEVKPEEVEHKDVRYNEVTGSISDIQNEVDKIIKEQEQKQDDGK